MRIGRVLTGVGLVIIGVAIVAVLIANTGGRSQQASSIDLRALEALAGSPLVASLRGPAALREVSRLHGKRIDATDALVLRYGNGIAVWISASATPLGASALLWKMNRRMSGGTTVFSMPRAREVHGRTVFTTDGQGQRHYYYQSSNKVLWLAGPPSLADEALEALLQLYP